MFIFEYDLLIDKILDKISEKMNKTKITSSNLEKIYNDSVKLIDYEINANIKNKIDDYTRKIIYSYLICLISLNEDFNKIKTIFLKSKNLNSEELASVFQSNEIIKTINEIIQEEDKDKFKTLYKKNEIYKISIDIINEFGYENTIINLKTSKNKNHNISKLVILKTFYRKFFRKIIFNLMFKENTDYKYINIVTSKLKLIEFTNIENILNRFEIRDNFTKQILDFNQQYESLLNLKLEINQKINYLFESKLVIPITDDFLRYHKQTEKYEKSTRSVTESDTKQDQTKLRYIVNKIEKIKDLYSSKVTSNKNAQNEILKLFYKPIAHKKAIIYNEIEEQVIVNKILNLSKVDISNNEFYYDLLKLRKYSYVNFKDLKSNGFNFRPDKNYSSYRYSIIESLENKTIPNKNLPMEVRTINQNFDSNIVGVAIISDDSKYDSLKINQFEDIRTLDDNGFKSFNSLLKSKIDGDLSKNYYWIFNDSKDKFSLDTFETSDLSDNSNLMLSEIYNNFLGHIYSFIESKIKSYEKIHLFNSNNIYNYYQNKFLKFSPYSKFDLNLKELINNSFPLSEDLEDKNEQTLHGILGNVTKLPEIKNESNDKIQIINISDEEKFVMDDSEYDSSVCQHILDWNILSSFRDKDPNKYNELLFNFTEKYLDSNDDNEFVCKSCKQVLDIKSYVSGQFDEGVSGFEVITTFSKRLTEIKEYTNLMSFIKNIDKLVERIAQILNFSYYLGNEQINKLRRQDITKNIIDIIRKHDSVLRTKNMSKRDREIKAFQLYGIQPEFSNFFIFPVSNDIFKFSSSEVDKFKKIKANNIISYILFFMILDLNGSQIMQLEFDKNCNVLIYDNIGSKFFDSIKIITNNSNDKENIKKYPALCYVLFYISCMISKYNLWFTSNNSDNKNKVIIQKSITSTTIDLINSLLEVYSMKEKNYLYEIICGKFINKLNNVFKDQNTVTFLREKESKKIKFNQETKKIQIKKSLIDSILLDKKIELPYERLIQNSSNLFFLKYKKSENVNIPLKEIQLMNNTWNEDNILKLSMIYNNKGNFREIKMNKNDAKNLSKTYLNEMIKNINIKKNDKKDSVKDNLISNISYVEDLYKKLSIENKILKIVNEIENVIGTKETIDNITFNLDKAILNLKNDYLGSKIKNHIYINEDDKKIKITEMDENKFYEITDIKNNKKLLFSYYTNLYNGYLDKREFKKINSNKYIEYIPSLKELIETFGITKRFYIFEDASSMKTEISEIIGTIKENLKQLKQFLFKIRYKMVDSQSNEIIKFYVNKISKINLSKKNESVFSKIDTFLKFEKIDYDLKLDKYYSKYDLINKIPVLKKLINYFISEINFVLEINSEKYTKINFIRFIFSSILFFYRKKMFNVYNFDLIRYKFILDSELLETIRDTYVYTDEELMEDKLTEEEKERKNDEAIESEEQLDALDALQESDENYDEEGGEIIEFSESDGYLGLNAVNMDFKFDVE